MSKKNVSPLPSLKPDIPPGPLLQILATSEFNNFDKLHYDHWRYEAIRNLTNWIVTPNNNSILSLNYQRYCFSRLLSLVLANSERPIHMIEGGKVDKASAEVYAQFLVRTLTIPDCFARNRIEMIRSALSALAIHLGMGNAMLIKYQLVMLNVWTFIEDEPGLKDIFFGAPGIADVVASMVATYQETLPYGYDEAMLSMHNHVINTLNDIPTARAILKEEGIFLA